ncbi:MAG TPA: hypothetical protein VFL49_00250 [Pseudolabrys sp.]|nr:hypothetical protein [Pseudolabrys sp.]
MAIRITIPGIVRLAWLRQPDEVIAANDSAVVQRSLSGRGGLWQRSIAAKLAVFQTADGNIWPAFRDRLDPLRAKQQSELEAAMSDTSGLLARLAPETDALAAYVRSGQTNRPPEIIVQQMVGRLFFPDYAASEESYDAAWTLQAWLASGPIKSYSLKCSGELERAIDRIISLAHGNTSCAHATAIAMENIVNAIERMRRLARRGNNLGKLSPEEVLACTLRAPKRVIRETRDGGRVGGTRFGARTLLILGLEAARRHNPEAGIGFFVHGWNRCPAHAIVPALLAEVWKKAKARAETA